MTDAASELSLAERIDALCDRFEQEFRTGQTPRIERYLESTSEPLKSALFRALLELEWELRQRRGETPQLEEYASRFSDRKDDVRRILEDARSVLSSVKPSQVETSKGPSAAQRAGSAAGQALKKLGRFEILSVLGEGAFGTVYKAHDPQLDRDVAVKVPRFGALQSPEDRERFLREARSAAGLHQAHICPVHEVGTVDGRDYIVMAFIDGKPLSKVLQTQSKLTDKQVVSVIRKLALALEEAHQKGIIHRDLKPANIMINRKGEPVIMDFGLARRSNSGDAQISQSGQILGTPAYMSPEQARGDGKSVGPAADVYSLGVIFYEMLCGRRPFEGTVTEVIGQILHVEAEPPSLHRPGVDPRLEAICLKAVAKKPAERFASMKDFAAALAEYAKSASTVAPKAEPTVARDDEAALHTDQFARLIEAVSSDFEEKVERAARRAVRKSRKSHKIKVPWWTYLVGSGLMGLIVLFGIFFFIRKDTVTVIVNIPIENINDPSLSFLLDDKPIAAEAFAKPIDLKPGEHELIVNKNGKQYRRFLFNVGKGDNEPVIVQDVTPKTDTPELALERLQGRWIAVEQARGGAKLAADELKAENKVMTIQGDRFSIEYQLPANRAQRGAETGTIARIDPSVSPAEIDMVFERGEAGPVHFKGIFALDGNRLVHCYRKCAEDEGDCERPRDYETVRGQPVFHVVYERASAGPRRVEVKELNLTGYDAYPWISTDGKRIYFESRKLDNESEPSMWIYSASRPDARTPFSGKQALFSGRHPALTGDELEMVFIRGPQGNASLRVARRNSSNQTFVSEGEISELKDQVNPKSPALSEDGLTLVFQRGRDEQKTVEFVFCTRTDRTSSWSKPQTLPMTADPAWTEPLTWPFLSRDGLTLWYCHGGGKTPDIRMATRPDVKSPFGNHQPVIVEGTPLVGRSPRFVQATSELFYSPNLTDTQGDWSLWVVKDFAPAHPVPQDDDLARWQGTWRCIAENSRGQTLSPEELTARNHTMVISGNRRSVERTFDGKVQPYSGTFQIRSAASWKEFDFDFDDPNHPGGQRGMYEFAGQKLRLVYRSSDAAKPARAAWTDRGQPNVVWFEFERVDDGWVNLFNGKDLTGWKAVPLKSTKDPGRRWWAARPLEGVLESLGEDHLDLETELTYRNFTLRFEWRFTPGGKINANGSGIIVRGRGLTSEGPLAGFDLKGIEIDMRPNSSTANKMGTGCFVAYGTPLENASGKTDGIQDRHLGRLLEPVLASSDGWNACEITCNGDRITVLINGAKVSEAWGAEDVAGSICLRNQKSAVQFRNIRIRELPNEPTARIDGWIDLFNGKDLTGWKTLPSLPGGWTVENGLLTGRTKDLAYLFSERGDYSDFHLRAECRTNRFGNGGIFFRSPFALDRNKGRHPGGYEAQIIHEHPKDFANLTGSLLIAESGRQPLHKERRKLVKHDEWFTMEVIARGKQLLVKINGDVVAQATDDGFSQGHISLQCLKDQDTKADDPTSLVQFRKIDIKEFGKESPPAAASNIPADRIAADAVLAHGGQVTIELANGDRRDVDAVSKLPDEPFQVVFAGVPPGATATAGYLSTLKDLKGLRSVLLHSPPFSDRDFEILAAIPNLQSFNLGASKLDGSGFRLLRGSANIRHITLWGESQIDDQALADVGSLPNLELLAFSSPRVTAAGLRALKPLARLRALNVSANFDSEMVAAIGECEQLTELLVLGGTGITDADLRLLSRLTRLPNLWIGQPKVTDAGVQALGELSQLTSLHVTNSRITPAVTTNLNSLVNLKELSLNYSNLKGIDFSTLKLPLAATVSLAHCRLRDDDLRGLDGLPRLQTLVLSGNPLTDASIDEFAKITTLRSILLDGTGITRRGVERLKNLRAELTVRGVQ